MSDVALFLLAISGIFLLGALGEIVFQRTSVPDVIWLILVGILLGPLTGAVSQAVLNRIAPFFAAITLVVVLFEGGSALRLRELSRAAPRSTLLAVLTFASAVVIVSTLSMGARVAGVLPGEWSWTHGLMLGAILGGSSSIIIMPAMAQARINAKIANLVSLESALTDAFCVVGTTALVDLMLRGGGSAHGAGWMLARSFGIALVVGIICGTVWLLFLRFLHSNEHAYPVTLAALLALYVLVDHLGGSAAFGILTFAVVLGNAKVLSTKFGMDGPVELDSSVRGFHRQMAFIVKSFFFVFIGAMLGPPWISIGFGILLGVALFLVRVPSVNLALAGSGLSRPERALVHVALPRGMAAGVLATLPASAGVPGTETLPIAVFACVFTTILAFAVGFPVARRRVAAGVAETPAVALPAGAARPELAGTVAPGEVVAGGGAATIGTERDKSEPSS
jgi:cell volume regulation protein A